MARISKLTKVVNSSFEGANSVAKFTAIVDSAVGYGTYVGSYSKITKCRIGRYCSIAHNVEVVFGNHPTKRFVSTHPAFYTTENQVGVSYIKKNIFEEFTYADAEKCYFVDIGNDVWIGAHTLLMAGVHIGDGAIIAAGSIVTKDVPPYAIVGGATKIIRYRFSEDEIAFLKQLKWWNKGEKWIKEHADQFDDIKHLKESLDNV